jgi:hypothetical protein
MQNVYEIVNLVYILPTQFIKRQYLCQVLLHKVNQTKKRRTWNRSINRSEFQYTSSFYDFLDYYLADGEALGEALGDAEGDALGEPDAVGDGSAGSVTLMASLSCSAVKNSPTFVVVTAVVK